MRSCSCLSAYYLCQISVSIHQCSWHLGTDAHENGVRALNFPTLSARIKLTGLRVPAPAPPQKSQLLTTCRIRYTPTTPFDMFYVQKPRVEYEFIASEHETRFGRVRVYGTFVWYIGNKTSGFLVRKIFQNYTPQPLTNVYILHIYSTAQIPVIQPHTIAPSATSRRIASISALSLTRNIAPTFCWPTVTALEWCYIFSCAFRLYILYIAV